jgi:hypothetical protein
MLWLWGGGGGGKRILKRREGGSSTPVSIIDSTILDRGGDGGIRPENMNIKRTVSPDYICFKVVWFNRPRIAHGTLDTKINSPLNFSNGSLKFLSNPH